MTEKVQRWTGTVSASDGGGFVAYGDYLALQARCVELDRLCDATYVAQGADAYNHACECLEDFQRKRHNAGKEVGTTGSLCDGMAWVYGRLEETEAERNEALAKLRELENLTAAQQASNLKLVAALNESEAKLRELEAQEPVGAVLQSATNYDSTWSFICSSKQYLKTGIPIYARPIPAQPTALELMREYSNGKQWALEEAAKICDEQLNKTNASAEKTKSVKAREIYSGAAQTIHWVRTAIRKLGEGL